MAAEGISHFSTALGGYVHTLYGAGRYVLLSKSGYRSEDGKQTHSIVVKIKPGQTGISETSGGDVSIMAS